MMDECAELEDLHGKYVCPHGQIIRSKVLVDYVNQKGGMKKALKFS